MKRPRLRWVVLGLLAYEVLAALVFMAYEERLRGTPWWAKVLVYAAFLVPPYLVWDWHHRDPESETRRKVLHDARHLHHECRRLLRKKGHDLPPSVREALDAARAKLKKALSAAEPDLDECAVASLQALELLHKHLAAHLKSTKRVYAEQIGYAVLIALCLRTFVVEAFKIPSGSMIPTLLVGDHIFVNKYAYGFSDPLAVFLNPLTWLPLGFPYAEKKLWVWNMPERGDVAVFVNPNTRQDFIKRIVGLPGDVIDFREGVLSVNGVAQPRDYLGEYTYEERLDGADGAIYHVDCALYEEKLGGNAHLAIHRHGAFERYPGPWVVEKDHVFVVGDNRDNSADSRVPGPTALGQIPLQNLKGRAMIIWLSIGGDWGIRFGRMFRGIR